MKNTILLLALFAIIQTNFGQQNHYNVNSGNGHGLRFWSSDAYKIHMGNSSEYKFGPVTDYSIKTNMSSNTGRGWTWGVVGATPIAALSNKGDFQLASSLGIGTANTGSNKLTVQGHVNIGGTGNYRLRTRHVDGKHFSSDAIDHLYLNYSTEKNVYIGYGSKPNSSLLVYGNIRNGGADFQLGIHDSRDQGTKTANRALVHYNEDRLYLNYDGDFEGGTFIDGPKTVFTWGNVGIGTINPGSWKLSVNGKIRAKEIKVETGWADYVFKDDYKLPTLEEVAKHIEEKGHLINIPSEAEVAENGIYLGEMNAKLLEKIEELTLYTIAQDKKLKELDSLKSNYLKLEKQFKKLERILTSK